jgi:hypothetical protein
MGLPRLPIDRSRPSRAPRRCSHTAQFELPAPDDELQAMVERIVEN